MKRLSDWFKKMRLLPVKQHLAAIPQPVVDRVGKRLHVALQLDVGVARSPEKLVRNFYRRSNCNKTELSNTYKHEMSERMGVNCMYRGADVYLNPASDPERDVSVVGLKGLARSNRKWICGAIDFSLK